MSRIARLSFVVSVALFCAPLIAAPPTRGIVVDELQGGSSLKRAGIEKGDVLVAWKSARGEGELRAPFDLREVFDEQLPLGPVTLSVVRGETPMSIVIPQGYLRDALRPLDTADEVSALWLLTQKGSFDEALTRATSLKLVSIAAQIGEAKAASLARKGDFAAAEKALDEARALRTPGSLSYAGTTFLIGETASRHRDIAKAEAAYKEALAIREKLAPEALETSATFNALARAAFYRGDMTAAEDYFSRSLRIQEKVYPGGFEHASNLNGLGVAAFYRGDLAAAEKYWNAALPILQKLVPDGAEVASVANNLAAVAKERGDFASAEAHLERSLAIRQKKSAESLDVAESLNNMGNLAINRKEWDRAAELLQKSLAIREKIAPASLDTAHSLNNLGDLARERGKFDDATRYYERSLALTSKIAANGVDTARDYSDLSILALLRNDATKAVELERQALAMFDVAAPNSFDVAESHQRLGEAAEVQKKATEADAEYRKALAIREQLTPGSAEIAHTLYRLGRLTRDRGKLRDAADLLRRAIEAIESQTARLGGSEEAKTTFLAEYRDYYRDYIDVLLRLGQKNEAFRSLERSRARRLLTMLAERDLLFAGDIAPELDRRRRAADREYDRLQEQLATATTKDGGVEKVLGRMREVRDEQNAIVAEIRKSSPRLASLQYPTVLDARGAAELLDKGTLLLSYSVGRDDTILFAVTKETFKFFRIPIGEAALRKDVERFRTLISRNAPLEKESRALGRLLNPAESLIAHADRLLIAADGPLHLLPFAAVTLSHAKSFLVEAKPIVMTTSATVFAEVKKRRTSTASGDVELAAFGDPAYPNASDAKSADPAVRSLVQRYGLEPLPGTRDEVMRIASLFGPTAKPYLGAEATEEMAKQVASRARYLHFASHGLLNPDFPLDSALVLSIPQNVADGRDNGLLQVWEVFDSLRTNATLVVLSACETALGREEGGEGLVGITRAFQYAGAQTVFASLWNVADTSTATLMENFYRHLRSGETKEVALRSAQMELLRSSDAALRHPYHWAAFEMIGDWK
jgi:CHAT domain-containing protein/Tfp pilus assembly protein PilF